MSLILKPGTAYADAYARCVAVAPEAFHDDRVLNLWGGQWRRDGAPIPATSAVDGTEIAGPPFLSLQEASAAVAATAQAHREWRQVPLVERKAKITAALDALQTHRDLLSLLLVWEIGKPWRLATNDVDRCIDGVRWYVEEIDRMLVGRAPLAGPVSNIASWNYPMSVLMHAMLVQLLAGNAVIAKTPTDGGLACLTLACALAAREVLPITLVSGSGRTLSPALVAAPEIGGVSFVGGRAAGSQVESLVDQGKRHILEQEGLNCWGVWEFSDWKTLSGHLRKSFDYAKQRCTAYPRYVVQRSLFDDFLTAYLPVLDEVRFGHPLAVASPDDALPDLDYGPLINAAKVKELNDAVAETLDRGGVPLYRGDVGRGRFIDGQDRSAYLAPVVVLSPPSSSALFHAEPFGPVDTIVLVDTEAELLTAMNASNGALVASLACDDEATAQRLGRQLQAFKVGINKPRSRGDREEVFGGNGASWRGAFVGGELLVRAVTDGAPDDPLHGNFPSYTLHPAT
ncbi:aldehyde dehydrogenase family protein [Streptomyces carpinensis]|uniref:Aldehyde dehydrogenase family protein n=1 Tax=Streptomyces carpinensis TaxID=66369 RepID=A0ABV1VU97_9ACTN|nr:aldehyde dehydrogenase family protein [Streptomyces carpinensis]